MAGYAAASSNQREDKIMPTMLRNLKISEVSSVDRGAGEGVQILLMKRADEAEDYFKRTFSDAERQAAASSGAALPDGSFPIKTKADLENAIHAYGRAKNKPEAKAHIISRAKALDCADMIPDGWDVGKSIVSHVSAASAALLKSVVSIFKDKATADKAGALAETFGQFEKHLAGVLPDEVVKAAEAEATKLAKESAMTEAEKKAAEEKAAAEKAEKEKAEKAAHEETSKALAKALGELAILKMSQKHKDFMDQLEGDEKGKFAAKTPEERDAHMEKNPIEKRLPESVRKALAKAEENEKILKSLQEKDEIATFAKRADDLGLAPAQGEVLRKAYAGDKDAIAKLEALIKGMSEQIRTGVVFKEFGGQGRRRRRVRLRRSDEARRGLSRRPDQDRQEVLDRAGVHEGLYGPRRTRRSRSSRTPTRSISVSASRP
jgi:hypothetical protein